MFKIDSNTKQISVTRGDIAPIDVKIKNSDGTDYSFSAGDVVRFSVFKKKDCNCIVLLKEVQVTRETTNVRIDLTSQDTKIGDLISKPSEYWYEIELNPKTNPQTIIGYDEKGAKVFMLYPEGADEQ